MLYLDACLLSCFVGLISFAYWEWSIGINKLPNVWEDEYTDELITSEIVILLDIIKTESP